MQIVWIVITGLGIVAVWRSATREFTAVGT
jgi:hypothetical protein